MKSEFKRKLLPFVLAAATINSPLWLRLGEGDDDDDDNDDNNSFSQKDIDAAVQKVKDEMSGIVSNRDTLLQELKDAKKAAKKFEGVDVEALLQLKQQVEGDEILSLIAEGKADEAISKATERQQATHEADMKKLQDQLDAANEVVSKDKERLKKLLIDDGAKSAFIEAGGEKTAVTDLVLRARNTWVEDDDGTLVARDDDGNLINGKDGPITMSEWVESLKESSPHLFPRSKGAGLGGDDEDVGAEGLDAQILEATRKQDFKKLRKLREERQKRSA